MATKNIDFGLYTNDTLYRASFNGFEEKELKVIEESELDDAIVYFKNQFDAFNDKLVLIEQKIAATENKGSFLSSLENIKIAISSHDGLGDYAGMLDRITSQQSLISAIIAKKRIRNTDIKKALLLELDTVLANNDMVEAFEQIKDIQSRWVKTGSVEEELRVEIESKYKTGIDSFFDKRKIFYEDKKDLVEVRVRQYEEILKSLKAILKNIKIGSDDMVKHLQKEWKEIGAIGQKKFKELNDEYWQSCQQFFGTYRTLQKEAKKSKDKNSKTTLQQKEAILASLARLAVKALLEDASRPLDTAKSEWKSSGYLSKEKHGQLHQDYLSHVKEITEKQFIQQLTRRKNAGFNKKSEKEKLQAIVKVTHDLLHRDEKELKSFSENMDNMNFNKGSFVDMLTSKLQAQKDKVGLKKRLLNECREKIKHLE